MFVVRSSVPDVIVSVARAACVTLLTASLRMFPAPFAIVTDGIAFPPESRVCGVTPPENVTVLEFAVNVPSTVFPWNVSTPAVDPLSVPPV